jgi:hypothetical protein
MKNGKADGQGDERKTAGNVEIVAGEKSHERRKK